MQPTVMADNFILIDLMSEVNNTSLEGKNNPYYQRTFHVSGIVLILPISYNSPTGRFFFPIFMD